MSQTIRLTITDDLQKGIEFLKKSYPFLSPDEILKLAFSKLYKEELEKSRSRNVLKSTMESIMLADKNTTYETEEEFEEWWDKNKKDFRP